MITREVNKLTYEQTAALLDGMLNYWPNVFRGNDTATMTKAWAVALRDVPFNAAKRGVADLARTLKFPPTAAEIVQAAKPYEHTEFDARLAYERCTTFGIPLPVWYEQTAGEKKIGRSAREITQNTQK